MSMNLKLDVLERLFRAAAAKNIKYIGLKIHMEGFPEPEYIINSTPNFVKKLEYYKKTYNQDLTHKANPGIKIIDFSYGNSFSVLEAELTRM